MAVVSIPELQADEDLLRRFVARREADAFAELARRHTGLVFGTCLRVTGDRHDAEELAQECFLRLATRASTVRSSVAGWLHATATRLAINAVRAKGRRRAHEATAVGRPTEAPDDPSPWREIEPILDEAVESLPDDLREAIVLHFLRSLPQSEVAARLDVHQSTVSRRIAEGLRRLQGSLTASGVSLAAIPLADVLVAAFAPAGVPDLSRAVSRITLSEAAGGLLGAAGSGWAKFQAWTALVVALGTPLLLGLFVEMWFNVVVTVLALSWIAWRRPAIVQEISAAQGGRGFDEPCHPLTRWEWTTPPRDWHRASIGFIGFGFAFLALAWAQARIGSPPGLVATLAIYSLLLLFNATRLLLRAYRFRDRPNQVGDAFSARRASGLVVIQWMLMAVACTFFVNTWALIWLRDGVMDQRSGLLVLSAAGLELVMIAGLFVSFRAYLARPGIDSRTEPGPARDGSCAFTRAGVVGLIHMVALPILLTVLGGLNASRSSRLEDAFMPVISLVPLIQSLPLFPPALKVMRRGRWLAVVAAALFCAVSDVMLYIATLTWSR